MKKPRTRKEMVAYLTGHFRYDTMNSWNQATSYAANVKIHHHDWVPDKLMDRAFEILEQGDVLDDINRLLEDWGRENAWTWQAWFRGRSGGYIVLGHGGSRPGDHKSRCMNCGQRNFTSVKENSNVCGRCNKPERVDFKNPPVEVYTQPGKSVDMGETFTDWDMYSLGKRVDLVWSFDRLVAKCKGVFLDYCRRFEVKEKEIMVPKKIKVLEEVA